MLVATHNVNGIRAAQRRGFGAWLETRCPDVACLQEVRCQVPDLPGAFTGYHVAYDPGSIKGRNGVAVLTREPVVAVRTWGAAPTFLDPDGLKTEGPSTSGTVPALESWAHEGRYIEVDLADAPLTVACVYIPKGESPLVQRGSMPLDEATRRHERKMAFLARFRDLLSDAAANASRAGRHFVCMGDFNIAHTNQDLRNWKSNQKTAGFLPVEREWMDSVVSNPLVDVVRALHPGEDGPYSWWSWRGRAFTNDAGWRIDYQLADEQLAASAVSAGTDKDAAYDARISDHAPVVVDYRLR